MWTTCKDFAKCIRDGKFERYSFISGECFVWISTLNIDLTNTVVLCHCNHKHSSPVSAIFASSSLKSTILSLSIESLDRQDASNNPRHGQKDALGVPLCARLQISTLLHLFYLSLRLYLISWAI